MHWAAVVPTCTWRNYWYTHYILHHGIVHVCMHVESSLAQSSPHLGLGLQYPVLPPQLSLEGSNVGILHSQQISNSLT